MLLVCLHLVKMPLTALPELACRVPVGSWKLAMWKGLHRRRWQTPGEGAQARSHCFSVAAARNLVPRRSCCRSSRRGRDGLLSGSFSPPNKPCPKSVESPVADASLPRTKDKGCETKTSGVPCGRQEQHKCLEKSSSLLPRQAPSWSYPRPQTRHVKRAALDPRSRTRPLLQRLTENEQRTPPAFL